jgi:hypothetical protein
MKLLAFPSFCLCVTHIKIVKMENVSGICYLVQPIPNSVIYSAMKSFCKKTEDDMKKHCQVMYE